MRMEAKRCRCGASYSWKAYVAMICLQFGYAGMNLITNTSLQRDVSHFVIIVYRQAFATLIITPLALFFDRKARPTITFPIFMHMFILGLLGPVMEQNLYYAGLELTSPSLSSAVTNLVPAFTFSIALVCRLEKVEKRWRAKVGGTILTVAGSLLIIIRNGHSFLSVLYLLGSTLSSASFFILLAITLTKYPAPLTLTALVCALGTLQSTAFAFLMADPTPSAWNIGFGINLFAACYAGLVTSGIAYYVQGLVVEMAGPVFVSAFNPLLTLLLPIISTFLLATDHKIDLAWIMGATLMILGACSLLWGKHKDIHNKEEEEDDHIIYIPKMIKVISHSCSLPTIFEDDDVEANASISVKIEMSERAKSDNYALTKVVIVPLESCAMEAPEKMQSSQTNDSIKNELH